MTGQAQDRARAVDATGLVPPQASSQSATSTEAINPPPEASTTINARPRSSRRNALFRLGTSPSPSPFSTTIASISSRKPRANFWTDRQRDTGRATTVSTLRPSVVQTDDESQLATTLGRSVEQDARPPKSDSHNGTVTAPAAAARLNKVNSMKHVRKQRKQEEVLTNIGTEAAQKLRISMDIPSNDLIDLTSFEQMAFSNRGSILMGDPRARNSPLGHEARAAPTTRQKDCRPTGSSCPGLAPVAMSRTGSVKARALSVDEESLSRQVRLLYEGGGVVCDPPPPLPVNAKEAGLQQESLLTGRRASLDHANVKPTSDGTTRRPRICEGPDEGREEWDEIDWSKVDRYGFIVRPPRAVSQDSVSAPNTPNPHRVSTILHLDSATPRLKRNFGLRRADSRARPSSRNAPNVNSSSTSLGVPKASSSHRDGLTRRRSQHPIRTAVNRFPGNRDRRNVDEASDMLGLAPGLADITEDGGTVPNSRATQEQRRREWSRAEKWRRMAKKVDCGDGSGMSYRFDAGDPKLISRTWKGIPDCWRATAWHSFLLSSAAKRPSSPSDAQILAAFHAFLPLSSPDDVQIDIDTPRTITAHILFRQRYRSGQRLLFRVLHCLSLYFPTLGYVQGMASLAATLLCYYDEESCFIMMVRLFQLRGMERLYEPGFGGLVEAIGELERTWLKGTAVEAKLKQVGMDGMIYGTRWYLTAFNYSIPFQAMLRVWDVWILLGDPAPSDRLEEIAPPGGWDTDTIGADTIGGVTGPPRTEDEKQRGFDGGMDILHATSAALIDGMRDLVLDEDFEGVMKCLTRWISVRDEEVMMRVVRTEWRKHRQRRVKT